MRANRGFGCSGGRGADGAMTTLATPKTSALKAAASVLLASLLLIYTGHAGQQGDSVEELLPVESAGYSPIELDVGQPTFVTAGDVDEDGHVDLVLLSFSVVDQEHALQTQVHLVKVDWTTGGAYTRLLHTIEHLAEYAAISDFDGDRHLDIIVFDNRVGAFVVLRGDGYGSFGKEVIWLDRHGFVGNFSVADVDGDGYADIVFGDLQLGHVQVLWGDGRPSSLGSSTYSFPADHYPGSVVTADFAGNERLEVAVLGLREDEVGWVHFVALFSIDRGRQLSLVSTTDIGKSAPMGFGLPLAAGDYNRDGHLDLLTVRSEHVYVMLGRGDGSFSVEEVYWLLGEPDVPVIVLADLSGNGCLNDIVVGRGSARLWVSSGCYGESRSLLVAPVVGIPVSAAVADVNKDGTPDLIVATNSLLGSTYLEVLLGH